MLAHDHPQAARVRALLTAARRAADLGSPPESAPIGIDVLVHAPHDARLPDATNLLGGIADVLEVKSRRELISPGVTAHLGELAKVGLYKDDAQIREVHYRRTVASSVSYRVRLWTL